MCVCVLRKVEQTSCVCHFQCSLALKRFATNVAMRQQKSQKKGKEIKNKKPAAIPVKLKVSHSKCAGKARSVVGGGRQLIPLGQLSESCAALTHKSQKPKIAFALSEQIQHVFPFNVAFSFPLSLSFRRLFHFPFSHFPFSQLKSFDSPRNNKRHFARR